MAERLRTFTNSWISAIRSCAFDIDTFCLDDCFKACNLKQFGLVCLVSPQKWQNHWGLLFFLLPNWLVFLGLDSLKSTLVLLEARTSSLCTLTLDTNGWTIEEDVTSTNLGRLTTVEDPL